MTGRRPLVYLVSRFPLVSETFIVRELDAVAAQEDLPVGLRSLFPAPPGVVHPIASRWIDRLITPDMYGAVRGVGWAVVHRPGVFGRVLRTVIAEYCRSPTLLIRALVTVALACAHARDLSSVSPAPHIHAHYATYPALAAWVCHQLIGATYSFTAHAHDLYVNQAMLGRKVADAALVVTISEYNRAILQGVGHARTPVEVIHCGIDPQAYPFRLRKFPDDAPICALTVASLQEYKGHEVLLRAIAVGGGPIDRLHLEVIGDGPLRSQLEDLTRELGIDHRVLFRGSRTEAQVLDALTSADLFVLPSVVAVDGQMEGLPVALMEALACGLPVVSTDLSGIPEIVIEGVTGRLARPGDVHDLNRALRRAIVDHDPVTSEAGRALVDREFDLVTTTATLAGWLKQIRALPESAGGQQLS